MDKIPVYIASMGIIMDGLSHIALISTIFGKKSSGFLYIGFGFYLLATVTAYIIDKKLIPFFLALMIFHFAVNVPLKWMNKSQ